MNLCDFTSVTIQTANLCIHFDNYFMLREQASDEDGKAIKMYIYIYLAYCDPNGTGGTTACIPRLKSLS